MRKKQNLIMPLIISALLCGTGSSVATGGILYVDAASSVDSDGSAWGAAFKYLQDALTAAVSGDTILVAQGTYRPDEYHAQPTGSGSRTETFQLKNGVIIEGGYAGIGEPNPDARDIDTYETILSGDIGSVNSLGDNSYQVLTGIDVNQTAVLDGFTITAGNADDVGNHPYDKGSGMRNSHSSPTLIHCTFTGNWSFDGGAMHNSDGSSPTLTNCTFSDNATERGGGAINNQRQSSPILTNCTFRNNSSGWGGGAINNVEGCNATFINCSFSYNGAGWGGGGIDNQSSSPTLTNCTFSSNWALAGGAILSGGGSNTELTNCIIWDNSPQDIYNDGGSTIINFSDVRGGWPGIGNLDADPLFVAPVLGDYHLLPDSPCIDAGNNADVPPSVLTDRDGKPRIAAGIVDMGAYELRRSLTIYVDVNACGNNNGTTWDNAFNDLQDALAVAYPGNEIRVGQGTYTPGGPLQYQASNPNPPDDPLTPVSTNVDLIWTPGAHAASHDVYFGPNSPGTFQGNQTDTTFDPGTLAKGTTYYWRIDEVGPHGTTTGPVWSFTTRSGRGRDIGQDVTLPVLERAATFQLKNGVVIKGGYAGCGQSDPNARDVDTYKTILSGDLARNDLDVLNPLDPSGDLGLAENSYHVVTGSDCNDSAVLDGFVITAGNANGPAAEDPNAKGGGMYNTEGNPSLINCRFIGNLATWAGAGMYNQDSRPRLTNCGFSGNSADKGGAIYYGGEIISILTNCTFSGNSADKGGAIYNSEEAIPILINCTISRNLASSEGGGMCSHAQSRARIMNCILWGNIGPTASQIHDDETSRTTATYSDIQGGWPGQGNINVEPRFVDPGDWDANGVWIDGDYHLLQSSPCINASNNNMLMEDTQDLDGDSDTTEPIPYDMDNNPRIVGEVVDMGAFEFDSSNE